jgi:hypothetical protein
MSKHAKGMTVDIIGKSLMGVGVRAFEQRLYRAYSKRRKQRGFPITPRTSLNFADDDVSGASRFIEQWASGQDTGFADEALVEALRDMGVEQVHNQRRSSASVYVSTPHPNPMSSPEKEIIPMLNSLTRVELLLLGVSTPAKETDSTLLEFLSNVLGRVEVGSAGLSSILARKHTRTSLLGIATRFLEPPVDVLLSRVESIINKFPEKEPDVSQALAQCLRRSREVNQQLVYANAQLSQALRKCAEIKGRDGGDKRKLTEGFKTLDETRMFAVREMNDSLRSALMP